MIINTVSHTHYPSQPTDSPTPLSPDQLTQRPVDKNNQGAASQSESDQHPSFSQKDKSENTSDKELSKSEQKQIEELKTRDREVRAHEAAHKNAAGNLAKGGPQYSYQTGPDGHRYAVGGEVSIDTSKERSPEATIRKAQKIRQAANAPAEPSSQDRAVAAQATKMEAEARQELQDKKSEKEGSDSKYAAHFEDVEKKSRTPGSLVSESA